MAITSHPPLRPTYPNVCADCCSSRWKSFGRTWTWLLGSSSMCESQSRYGNWEKFCGWWLARAMRYLWMGWCWWSWWRWSGWWWLWRGGNPVVLGVSCFKVHGCHWGKGWRCSGAKTCYIFLSTVWWWSMAACGWFQDSEAGWSEGFLRGLVSWMIFTPWSVIQTYPNIGKHLDERVGKLPECLIVMKCLKAYFWPKISLDTHP